MSYTLSFGSKAAGAEVVSVAKSLQAAERRSLAIQVLAGTRPVSELACHNGVSRKFLYEQAEKASHALDDAFSDKPDDSAILFHLPVTKKWLRQFVLELSLVCHAPMRGIEQAAKDLLDSRISLGTIHNILRSAVEKARQINAAEDLRAIKIGAHDEIFQAGKPVLVGVDVSSTYCYLLSQEQSRDANTWGIRLLELLDRGFNPAHTIADAAQGLRAGQKEVLPGVPCHGDVFHLLREMGQLVSYLENRALGAISVCEDLQHKIEHAKRRSRGAKFSRKLGYARATETAAIRLADDIAILSEWLRQDILAVVGPPLQQRQELYDFVVEELRQRELLSPHRIGPLRRKLENQRDQLLAFCEVLEQRLASLASENHLSSQTVRAIYELEGLSQLDERHRQREAALRRELGSLFEPVQQAVRNIIDKTVRASSVVENLNSILRCYFFLRRQLGPEYLDLLRFFLNHRRFLRSEDPRREGRSPAEILTSQQHPHWLEMLGFDLFKRAA